MKRLLTTVSIQFKVFLYLGDIDENRYSFFLLLILIALLTACADKPPANDETNPSPAAQPNILPPDYRASGTPFAERKLPPFRRLNYKQLTIQEWDEHWIKVGNNFPMFLCVADDEDFQTFYGKIEYPKEKLIISNPTEVLEFENGLVINRGRLIRGKLVFKIDEANNQITINDYPLVVNSYYWTELQSSLNTLITRLHSKYRHINIGGLEFHQQIDAFINEIERLNKYAKEDNSLDDETLVNFVKKELRTFDPSLKIDSGKASYECIRVNATRKSPEGFPPLTLTVSVCEHRKTTNKEQLINEYITRYNQNSFFGTKKILGRYYEENANFLAALKDNGFSRIEKEFPSDSQINDILKADLCVREKFYRLYQLFLPIYDYDSIGMSLFIKYLIEEQEKQTSRQTILN